MEDVFVAPRVGEELIDSSDGAEMVRWLLTGYLTKPRVYIRAASGRFDGMMCDPQGRVWGVVASMESDKPNVQLVLHAVSQT